MIIWEKIDEHGNPDGGPGYYFDHQSEICLVGRKGMPWNLLHKHCIPDIIRSQKGKAFQKPKELYAIIDLMGLGKRKIKLFARTNNLQLGYFPIGNEIETNKLRKLSHGELV